MAKAPEKAVEALKAEAVGVRHADGSSTVPLVTDSETVEILVPPVTEWYEGAVEHLRAGRITEWIKLAVEPDELLKWNSVRKRYRHLDAFLAAWTGATGEDAGESTGSSDS
jgi:hypothetical protein